MFDTVLIANRGEIARRVIRTLDRLGITSVAVFTDADRNAPHAREAGRAVAVASYLDLDAIIAAAIATGAQALHPGYGFLSESPALGAACTENAITFVGPPPTATALMGDKVAAKRAAGAAGLPVLDTFTAEQARQLSPNGYPLLVKAAAGGGGRGMRVVATPGELDAALQAAAREALAGFGDDRVFVERYLPRSRHLEVQVIADVHGTVLHLGERECSLQRRHQKVLEEAPSPAVGPQLRDRLGAEAVALATSAGYVNAGTVEFLADASDPETHFFLEMNARLQVEHPVTEAVTGLDLVELQLRVAAGEPLGLTQDQITLSGHAIEARVTAEDPARGFLPTTGRVLAYARPAADDPAARVDDAIELGSTVGTTYDSLLAKVIVHGEDRRAALGRLDHALAATTILGLTTSVGYLRALIARPEVVAGHLDTGLLERIGALAGPLDPRAIAHVAALLDLTDQAADAAAVGDPFQRRDGWRLGGERAEVRRRLAVAGREPVDVSFPAGEVTEVRRVAPGRFALGGRGEWLLARDGQTLWIGHAGWSWPVTAANALPTRGAALDGALRAPMPGEIIAVHAGIGDLLQGGDAVLVLESMKMELTLTAPATGTLVELTVSPGDRVTVDQPLARIEAAAG
jgi:acetyl-CoA/propionyl-CoA carboxylase biotin carboxyl carrier protein